MAVATKEASWSTRMTITRNDPVYFKSLSLTNVRSFGATQRLDMTDADGRPAQWTLILGDNGVGKTTLLQCLASMRPVPTVPDENKDKDKEDASASKPASVVPALLQRENTELAALARMGEEKVQLHADLVAGQPFRSKTTKAKQIVFEENIQVKNGELKDIEHSSVHMENAREPLVIGYGAARHMHFRGAEVFKQDPDPTASLFDPSVELVDARDILEQLDYAAVKRQPRARALLSCIKEALAKLLPSLEKASAIKLYGPTPPGSDNRKTGVQVVTPYGEVPFEALSLGYQTMTAWTVDLAWRLTQHYPDANDVLQMPAIVLIDELDLHLHPCWQREIRDIISDTFPRIQFIATAHSPLLAQSYLDLNLVVVRQEDGQAIIERDSNVVRTWRIDEVVTSALYEIESVYSPEIGRELRERTELLQKRRLTPANKKRLDELNKLAEELVPPIDTDNHRALDVIRRAASLLDETKK